MPRLLFICSQARLRSPTAAEVFAAWPGVEAECAGLNNDADVPLDAELLAWADHILVMEQTHRSRLQKKFGRFLAGKRISVLGIPDDYDYMEPSLVRVLKARVPRHVNL